MRIAATVGQFLGGFLWALVRGLGLIVRDIHRGLRRQIGDRIWWIYGGAGFVGYLYLTNQLWNFVIYGLYLVIIGYGLWMIISAPFRGRRGGRR